MFIFNDEDDWKRIRPLFSGPKPEIVAMKARKKIVRKAVIVIAVRGAIASVALG
jgi:hypothetical protein